MPEGSPRDAQETTTSNSPRFRRASRELIRIFSDVERRGAMQELEDELQSLTAAGEEEVSDRFYEILGITREDSERIFEDLRSGIAESDTTPPASL